VPCQLLRKLEIPLPRSHSGNEVMAQRMRRDALLGRLAKGLRGSLRNDRPPGRVVIGLTFVPAPLSCRQKRGSADSDLSGGASTRPCRQVGLQCAHSA